MTVTAPPPIRIVTFTPERAFAFESLNREWIERFFRIEDSDLKVLRDPQRHILDGGGQIFFALDGDDAVGTVAAVRTAPDVFELAKMGVKPSHQGRGIGELLVRAAIEYAAATGAAKMFLDTNDTLGTAIRLYERLGFVHAPRSTPSVYERSNVYMELSLMRPLAEPDGRAS